MLFPPPRPIDRTEPIPLPQQFANHDEFQPPLTDALVGLSFRLHVAGGPLVEIAFDDLGQMRWRSSKATTWGSAGEERYEAVAVRDGVYAITVTRLQEARSALLVVDRPGGRMLANVTAFVDAGGAIEERTSFAQGGIGGALTDRFERTAELVGKRVAHRYSTTHAFEHIYLNPNTYAFQGLQGPEAGVADVDHADYWKLGDRLYLLSWHERAQPFNGAVVLDLRDMRAIGRLVGWDRAGGRALQVRTGSVLTLIGTASYELV